MPLRNRLALLIVDALHDPEARRGLLAIAQVTAEGEAPRTAAEAPRFPSDLFESRGNTLVLQSALRPHAAELGDRARRAGAAVGGRPLSPGGTLLGQGLEDAAVLFDAGLFFETHEVLEPHWMRADGATREALQGLIQVAVGFQHLAHGNLRGAAALLRDGAAKLAGRRLLGAELGPFGRATVRCLDVILALGEEASARFAWVTVPPFPRG